MLQRANSTNVHIEKNFYSKLKQEKPLIFSKVMEAIEEYEESQLLKPELYLKKCGLTASDIKNIIMSIDIRPNTRLNIMNNYIVVLKDIQDAGAFQNISYIHVGGNFGIHEDEYNLCKEIWEKDYDIKLDNVHEY